MTRAGENDKRGVACGNGMMWAEFFGMKMRLKYLE
jgi:hypothetical protein